MESYSIIDEPRPRPWQHLIVNPNIILLTAIFVPLFWNPPFWGRFWIPAVWLVFNGVSLGSPTLRKELTVVAVGALVWLGILFATFPVLDAFGFNLPPETVSPYLRLLLFGVFFLILYLAVSMQSTAWQLFEYVRERNRR